MFSMSKITALLFAVALAAVQGFAPVSQPRIASNTELGAFFFGKPTETLAKKPVAKKTVAKKAAPVKKIVATKFDPSTAKNAAKKVEKPNPKLTIFPRTCHIN